MQLYHKGLAYESEVPVNWCPELKAVLANEEVVDGKSDIGGHPVYRLPMRQWMLKITKYADSLLKGLDDLDWPNSIKELQKNWIGRSEGANVTFELPSLNESLTVFTTRPDTLFGATYMVMAPEHPLVQKLDELGVTRIMNSGVKKINSNESYASEIITDDEKVYTADQIISTCGLVETEDLLGLTDTSSRESKVGNFSIIETISVFKGKPQDFGWDETVIFYNDSKEFRYEKPKGTMDSSSGVICLPENYQDPENQKVNESRLRITNPANFDKWTTLDEPAYIAEKEKSERIMLEKALNYLPKGQLQKRNFSKATLLQDTFTPKTIKKYTNHKNGALYG